MKKITDAENAMDIPGTINASVIGIDSKNQRISFCIPNHDSGLIIHCCSAVFSNKKLKIASKGYSIQTPVCNHNSD